MHWWCSQDQRTKTKGRMSRCGSPTSLHTHSMQTSNPLLLLHSEQSLLDLLPQSPMHYCSPPCWFGLAFSFSIFVYIFDVNTWTEAGVTVWNVAKMSENWKKGGSRTHYSYHIIYSSAMHASSWYVKTTWIDQMHSDQNTESPDMMTLSFQANHSLICKSCRNHLLYHYK